jgi:hypothetical protein
MDDWSIGKEIIDKISAKLPAGKQILELGSGSGTEELVKRWKVKSIEEDQNFVGKFHNDYVHCSIVNEWYDPEPLKSITPFDWDLLLIDGPARGVRMKMMSNIELFNFRSGQIVILDDIERDDDHALMLSLESYLKDRFLISRENFDSTGSKKFAVITVGDKNERMV